MKTTKKPRKLSQTKDARAARARRRRQKLAALTQQNERDSARALRSFAAKRRRRRKLAARIAPKAMKLAKLVRGMSASALTRETTVVIADGRGELQPYASVSDNFGEVNIVQRCDRIRVIVLLKGRTHRFDVVRPRR